MNKKLQIIVSLAFILILHYPLKAQTFEWAKSFGDSHIDMGESIATDASGNIYITGRFNDTVDFDPGAGTAIHSTSSGSNVFILKLDPSGNFIWAKSFGGSSYDFVRSITIDASGNVYTTGYFESTVDFDPGMGIHNLTAVGSSDIFIQKLDPSGNFIWAKSFGGWTNLGQSITTDGLGNVYTTGYFSGTGDFDPGAGTHILTATGYNDIFIQKLDPLGNFLWAKSFGGHSHDKGFAIAVDASGNTYTTGSFQGNVDFDPGAGTFNLFSSIGSDVFIQKLDSSGNFQWAKSFSGNHDKVGYSIAIDALGNIVTTGHFAGTVDFDPGPGTANIIAAAYDIFVHKLDASGNYLWAKSFGSTATDEGHSIAVDASGSAYVTGSFRGIVDFDPGLGTANLNSTGNGLDVFVLKLDSSGDYLWAKSFGGPYWDSEGLSLAVDASANVYTTGYFHDIVDFDPGTGIYNLTSTGNRDIFVNKLSLCNPNAATDIITVCDSLSWIDGTTYTASNDTATHTLINNAGCDSVVTLDLTVNYSTYGTDINTACDSYTWIDGITYTNSNNSATHILTNAVGCDSIITLDLTINHPTIESDMQTACDSYTWIDGITYTNSNSSATYTYTNSFGCDSVITLDLTINETPDTTISQANEELTAITSGVNYQWLDCNDNYSIISGAMSQTYIASTSGDYALEVSLNGCVDTSDCHAVEFSNLEEFGSTNFAIYPNPSSGLFHIDLALEQEDFTITLYDSKGKKIRTLAFENESKISFEINEEPGIYFAQISTSIGTRTIRLVKL